MATPHTTPATSTRPAPPAGPAAAPSDQAISTYLELFTTHSTDHAVMQPHGVNKASGAPYKKYIRRAGEITAAMVAEHLAGRVTLATQPQRAGRARAIVFDLDAGQDLQGAVERIAGLGLWAFGVASWSAGPDGAPAHQGGHIWVLLDQAAGEAELFAAAQAIAARAGLGAVECWPRRGVDVRLPFGRNQRGQAGREWGALYRPGLAPLELTSGAQGLAALLSSYRLNPLSAILAYAPAPECPQIAQNGPGRTKQAPADNLDGPRLIQAFNDRIDVRAVLEHFKARPAGPRRYRCGCGGHTAGCEDALKIVSLQKGGQGVQTFGVNCALYGKTHDAFGALQTLGGFSTAGALDEARLWLNMPAFEPARPAPRPLQRRHIPAAPPVVDHPGMVLQAAQHRAGLDGELTKAARRVLAVLLDQAAGRGWCQIGNRAIQLAADCCRATARTALYTLRDRGYITIDTSGNAWGGSEANIYAFCNPLAPQANADSAAQRDIQGGGLISVTPSNVLIPQYGGHNSAPAPETDPGALVTSTGPAADDEWASLFAAAPAGDEIDHEPAALDYAPRTAPPSAPGAPAAPGEAPAPVEAITPTTTRGAAAQQPISTAAPAVLSRGQTGPNAAALKVLLSYPDYVPGQPDLPAPPAAPAGALVDPPAALLNQAADLIDAGRYGDYEAFKAQHPGYCWADCTDLRASYRRWRGEPVLIERRPQAARREREQWSMAA